MGLKQVSNRIGPHLQAKFRKLDTVPGDAYNHFKKATPIRTGNARSNTNFEKKIYGGDIRGDYPYANRLNAGYSRQAPNGMTATTINQIKRLVRRILG